jgi:hypothetical protein
MINPSFDILVPKNRENTIIMSELMGYLAPVFALIVILALGIFILILAQMNINKKTTAMSNNSACRKVKIEKFIRNWTDFFWSNPMRFAWITLFLLTIIIYSYVGYAHFHIFSGAVISLIFSIITLIFFYFSWKSYYAFEKKAKKRLTAFEDAIKTGIDKEISFEGDNIQSFSKENEEMDTDEKRFYFPTGTKKVPYPLFQKNSKKQPIIKERKLEVLILSREYFSICKSATPFNLLDPKLGPPAKKCAEVKASGECEEHYYSQMRNVLYKDGAIQIIFDNEDDKIIFECPKMAPDRKPAIKALKEKLRITERQRLTKIDEHKKFIDIKHDIIKDNDIDEDNDEADGEE